MKVVNTNHDTKDNVNLLIVIVKVKILRMDYLRYLHYQDYQRFQIKVCSSNNQVVVDTRHHKEVVGTSNLEA